MTSQPPPYDPYMFPFPFHYPPPLFMNMPGNSPSNPSSKQGQLYHPPPMHMPPYGYPPFPMMYPPFHDPSFPFSYPKYPPKDFQSMSESVSRKESTLTKTQKQNKISVPSSNASKKQIPIIELSDDSQNKEEKNKVNNCQKKTTPAITIQQESQKKQLPRRTNRKVTPTQFIELPQKKVRLIKKKNIQNQSKSFNRIENISQKKLNVFAEPISDGPVDNLIRSRRFRVLTAKDGRGRIMIGDIYQARLPEFLQKNESKFDEIQTFRFGLTILKKIFSPEYSSDFLMTVSLAVFVVMLFIIDKIIVKLQFLHLNMQSQEVSYKSILQSLLIFIFIGAKMLQFARETSLTLLSQFKTKNHLFYDTVKIIILFYSQLIFFSLIKMQIKGHYFQKQQQKSYILLMTIFPQKMSSQYYIFVQKQDLMLLIQKMNKMAKK